MKGRAKQMLGFRPEVLYHDELSAYWAPELLSQVVARAATFGLSYVCDAQPKLNTQAFFPTEAYASIRARANGDWARFEQLADFRELRTFKNSVFARGGAVDQQRAPDRLRGLWASADLWVEEPDPNTKDGALLLSQNGVKLRTNNPHLVGLLTSFHGGLSAQPAARRHARPGFACRSSVRAVRLGGRSALLGCPGAGARPRRTSCGEPARPRAGGARRNRRCGADAHNGRARFDVTRDVAADGRDPHARRVGGDPAPSVERPARRGHAGARRARRGIGSGRADGRVAAAPIARGSARLEEQRAVRRDCQRRRLRETVEGRPVGEDSAVVADRRRIGKAFVDVGIEELDPLAAAWQPDFIRIFRLFVETDHRDDVVARAAVRDPAVDDDHPVVVVDARDAHALGAERRLAAP